MTLEKFAGHPGYFTLLDETKMELERFTLHAELWANKRYGNLTRFYASLVGGEVQREDENGELLFNEEGKPVLEKINPDLEVILEALCYLCTPDSKEKLRAKSREGESLEETLARHMNYKTVKPAAQTLFEAIRDALPEEAVKKIQNPVNAPNRNQRRAMQSKKRKAK